MRSSFCLPGARDEEWEWALEFIAQGGRALAAYPKFRKVVEVDGVLTVTDKRLIRMHRMSIGTITDLPSVAMMFKGGKRLGTVEESFISRIRVGGVFVFGGRRLELVRLRRNKATVQRATRKAKGDIPVWGGARMPLSNELAHAVAVRLKSGAVDAPEMQLLRPILDIQQRWSRVPHDEVLLLEQVTIRREDHVFAYTFAGRLVNEGLGALVAWRINRLRERTIQVTMNDYGFSLSSDGPLPFPNRMAGPRSRRTTCSTTCWPA